MIRLRNPALAGVVARDRVQHFIIEAIAGRQQTQRRLVFKGGTLLRTCWHDDYRYSEDLDFDWVTDPAETREELGLFFLSVLKKAGRSAQVNLDLRDRGGRMAVTWAIPQGHSGVIGLRDLAPRSCTKFSSTLDTKTTPILCPSGPRPRARPSSNPTSTTLPRSSTLSTLA